MKYLIKFFGVIALFAFAVFYGAFCWGLVCFKFWGWFILPAFPSLPVLNYMLCVGLIFFIGLFHSRAPSGKPDTEAWIGAIISPWITLGAGWLVHSTIM
jgi:hypothetical protein